MIFVLLFSIEKNKFKIENLPKNQYRNCAFLHLKSFNIRIAMSDQKPKYVRPSRSKAPVATPAPEPLENDDLLGDMEIDNQVDNQEVEPELIPGIIEPEQPEFSESDLGEIEPLPEISDTVNVPIVTKDIQPILQPVSVTPENRKPIVNDYTVPVVKNSLVKLRRSDGTEIPMSRAFAEKVVRMDSTAKIIE